VTDYDREDERISVYLPHHESPRLRMGFEWGKVAGSLINCDASMHGG